MNCEKHPNNTYEFQCSKCKIHLCKECTPVSLQGKIYCHKCSDIEEERIYNLQMKKASTFNSLFSVKWISIIIFLILISIGFYYFLFKPKVITVPPDDRELLRYYLNLAYDRGKDTNTYKRQMQNIKRLNMSYRHIITYLERAESNYKSNDFIKAIENFNKVKKILPDWDRIYLFISEAYLKTSNLKEAKENLLQCIELNPEGVKAYILVGDLYFKQNEYDLAKTYYSKALFNDKRNGDILIKLALVYVKQDRIYKAREFRNKANQLGIETKELDVIIKQKFIK